jgi:hypothetical protein
MLLGAPPARNDSRCLWWDEPRWVVLWRSPVAQAVLATVFLFYCIVPPLTGRPIVESVITSTAIVGIVLMTFFHRRRIAIDARGISSMPMPPMPWLNPFGFFTIAGVRLTSWPEVSGVRRVDATASRPAEMIVSRKYAQPFTVAVAPSIPLTAISDVLQEFGVAPWDRLQPVMRPCRNLH